MTCLNAETTSWIIGGSRVSGSGLPPPPAASLPQVRQRRKGGVAPAFRGGTSNLGPAQLGEQGAAGDRGLDSSGFAAPYLAGGLPGTENSRGFEVVALVMLASLVGVGVMKWRHWL